MCVTVKRSLALRLRNFFLPLQQQQLFHISTIFEFRSFVFLVPHQHLLSCGTRTLPPQLEGLSDGPDLIIGSSHQSFQSTSSISIRLQVGAQHTQRIRAKEETAENGLKTKEKQPSSVWGNWKRKRENRKPKTKTNVKPLIYLLAIS